VTSTRASQSRTATVDGLGRTTQKVTPEGGTWNYYYDSYSSCPTGYTGLSGQLTAVKDPNGNLLCYSYDALNRVTGVNANGTTCRHFYYDNSTGYSGSIPSGVSTPAYPNGRMVEAATDACAATRTSSTIITDEWFSYDKDGRATTQWESTPHSSTYYESVASYTGPTLTAVQLANPSLYTMTYGIEAEGRWSTLTDTTASQDIVTKTTFNAAGQPLNIQLTGTTPDQDIYTYDPNTGNMKTFEFEVGNSPVNLTGTLSWNANGSLGQVAITDGFNAGGTETCYSNSSGSLGSGYDDLERLIEFDCGSGNWGQEFSYDQYDNLTKTVLSGRTGTTWNPGYSPTSNHCDSPCTYDSNGDVTADGNDVYGWNEFSKLKWTATSGTPTCGSSGRCATYDAFGRMVEESNGSTWTEQWITQAGIVYMSGTTPSFAQWPGPGGGTETIGGNSGYFDYLHKDWLGNSRIVSNSVSHAITRDQAFTPYGETYNVFGASGSQYNIFAGTTEIFDAGVMWDTPNRELSYVGRWLSPDPAGSGWNQYAYVTNPNSSSDPTGLGDPPGSNSHSCTLLGGCIARSNQCVDSRKYTCGFNWAYGPVQGWDEFDVLDFANTPQATWTNPSLVEVPRATVTLIGALPADPLDGADFTEINLTTEGGGWSISYPNQGAMTLLDQGPGDNVQEDGGGHFRIGRLLLRNLSGANGVPGTCVTEDAVTVCDFNVVQSCTNKPTWTTNGVLDSPPGPAAWWTNYACIFTGSSAQRCWGVPGSAVKTTDAGPAYCKNP
jgi:RHS repeat-associated protein